MEKWRSGGGGVENYSDYVTLCVCVCVCVCLTFLCYLSLFAPRITSRGGDSRNRFFLTHLRAMVIKCFHIYYDVNSMAQESMTNALYFLCLVHP